LGIGAWSGSLISQTAYLEKKEKQWYGLCVDPFPVGFEVIEPGRVCDKAVKFKSGRIELS